MQRRGLEPVKRVAYFEYDFARDGGAIGDIPLRGDSLPDGAIVTDGKIDVNTPLVSTGPATVALKLLTAADTLDPTPVADWSSNAIMDVIPARTAATAIRNTANGTQLQATVADAALIGGKFVVALEYY